MLVAGIEIKMDYTLKQLQIDQQGVKSLCRDVSDAPSLDPAPPSSILWGEQVVGNGSCPEHGDHGQEF